MACRKLQSLKEHHHMGHISLSAMKKLEVSPRFEPRSLIKKKVYFNLLI